MEGLEGLVISVASLVCATLRSLQGRVEAESVRRTGE